ncbi:MAG: DUF5991 domain-containing protein [Burkholderiaceae bacterium]
MKRIFIIVALIFGHSAFAAPSAVWYGKYLFEDSGENATHTRSFVATHSLDVAQENGQIVATYRMTFNGDPTNAEIWIGHENGNALTFTYDHCLAMREKNIDSTIGTEESSGPRKKLKSGCTDSQKPGAVMLKLVRVIGKGNVPTLKTYWGELKPFDISWTKNGGEHFAKLKE